MLTAENKQFKLTDEGVILFQTDPTNPLPGKPVGKVEKGASITEPAVKVEGEGVPADADKDAVKAKLEKWIKDHVFEVLNPLMVLKDEEEIPAPARQIADKVYDAFGILPREELEELIGQLDETGRAALRQRKVRLGPVLVFLPMLNKPAAVRLRALLWQLWSDKPLPAPVPHDGITSISVDKENADATYYRAIGYPLYAGRAIRVDMLDRIISAVYDSADKGVFKAKHEMAEWLGCPIADLYDVLEAMGHKKIHDPADEATEEKPAEAAAEPKAEEAPAAEATETASEETASEEQASETKSDPAAQVKPELATFRLRKGKAYGGGQKKPFRKFDDQKGENKKPFKKKKPQHGNKNRGEKRERIVSAPAKKVEDSPFAVLKELKQK